ncbi:MAG: radical SAM protein [Oscillospiraceae bacterium]|jgi:threonylcarbamoyladenosine tRNA methylthiotransferase MtaB|nr:radical SAM protein [Oscillospiraceae bacterium]
MKLAILTLGCKVNQAESAGLDKRVSELGYTLVNVTEDADAYIVNTCAVTAEAERKSRQAIRRLASGGKPVYVAGCLSEIKKASVAELGAELIENSPFAALDIRGGSGGKPRNRSRALLKIQDGCENFCSYCIIPLARGTRKSLSVSEAVAAIRNFSADRVRETIITGIDIASYGADFPEPFTLAELIRALHRAAPDMRLQLGSLEPRIVTADFCEAAKGAVNAKFHLSLQSGCDSVLRRMNRKYDTARFTESVKLLREYFPECELSADVIVGFPGETESEFEETFNYVNSINFEHLHVFPYSIRPGTVAADMPNQVDKAVKTLRAERLRAIGTP